MSANAFHQRAASLLGPITALLLAASLLAVLLSVRPRLRNAASRPRRPLLDPYYNAAHFVLKDTYIGNDFLNKWTWETIDDPTHGRVNYVDNVTALTLGLTEASAFNFIMRADAKNIVMPSQRGRTSIRITSNAAYDQSVVLLDIKHMPEGCGTWPAFWSLSKQGPWPDGGEIDIIEGVNLGTQNLASLHTTPDCTMPQTTDRWMSGNATSTDCDTAFNFNQGCGVSFDAQPASYGAAFNAARGGFYAMARTRDQGVRIWFWPRDAPTVPLEVRFPPPPPFEVFPTPFWGPPAAAFPLTQENCGYDAHFDPHAFVFDLTFCGDWAGNVYSTSGCPGTCNDFVDNNPDAFQNAYWEINALRIYTPS